MRFPRTLLLGTLLVTVTAPLAAGRSVARVDWAARGSGAGEVLEEEGVTFLRVRGTGRPLVLEVLALSAPGVVGPRYALRGRVRHRDVEGAAYLEMWTELPGGGRYFTRTLAEGGPMGTLRGTSPGWREVELPFDLTGSGETPERLVLNVVLPGHGTVDLAHLELVDDL